jgi:peroxiredoxin
MSPHPTTSNRRTPRRRTPRRRTRRRPAAIVALGVTVALGLSACSGGGSDDGSELPAVDLLDADGDVVPTRSLVGEPLVVNFWYSTCPPCTKELREFAAVHEDLGESVRFVGVNPLDEGPAMVAFAAERGVTYELLRDELAELQTELEITAFPVTLFVQSDGTILRRSGVLDEDGLRSEIDLLLEAEA